MSNEEIQEELELVEPTHPTNILNSFRESLEYQDALSDARKASRQAFKERLNSFRSAIRDSKEQRSSIEKARLARKTK
jgi:hypothetical protein